MDRRHSGMRGWRVGNGVDQVAGVRGADVLCHKSVHFKWSIPLPRAGVTLSARSVDHHIHPTPDLDLDHHHGYCTHGVLRTLTSDGPLHPRMRAWFYSIDRRPPLATCGIHPSRPPDPVDLDHHQGYCA
jgi:hypothetical protein